MKGLVHNIKEIIKYLTTELDYHNEFTTKEAIIYTTFAIVVFTIALCGESVILSMF